MRVDPPGDFAGRMQEVLLEWGLLGGAESFGDDAEALRLAILLEDVFEVTFADDEIDLAVLTDPLAVRDVLGRRGRS